MNIYWWAILMGLALVFSGMLKIITNVEGSYWGFPVPVWAGWIFTPIGLYIIIISIYALRCGKGKTKPPQYTDEDATRAEAELDAMYLREHGNLPEKPKKDV